MTQHYCSLQTRNFFSIDISQNANAFDGTIFGIGKNKNLLFRARRKIRIMIVGQNKLLTLLKARCSVLIVWGLARYCARGVQYSGTHPIFMLHLCLCNQPSLVHTKVMTMDNIMRHEVSSTPLCARNSQQIMWGSELNSLLRQRMHYLITILPYHWYWIRLVTNIHFGWVSLPIFGWSDQICACAAPAH